MTQGEERLGALIDRMMKAGRISDAQRAATDPVYREEQYKVYNIDQKSVPMH